MLINYLLKMLPLNYVSVKTEIDNEGILLVKMIDYNYNSFTNLNLERKYELQEIGNFYDIVVYKTTRENYLKHVSFLSTNFEVFQDSKIQLDLPLYTSVVKPKDDWHLNRLVNRELNGTVKFNRPNCVDTEKHEILNYVVDTGIDIEHEEFQNRAVWGKNFVDEEDVDCHSHGTHVSGLIGSKSFGVCKNAVMIAVKVLDCKGSGSLSSIIGGLNWVLQEHNNVKNNEKVRKSVINMSLGGSKNQIIDLIVSRMVTTSNLYIVVASGNSNDDSCNGSPSGIKEVITVMASDYQDNRAYFSNYGECSNIYSPGVDITSTVPNQKYAKYSGTSMSTPITVGVLNHYLNKFPESTQMSDIKKKLYELSTKDLIKNNPKNTFNYLVFLPDFEKENYFKIQI